MTERPMTEDLVEIVARAIDPSSWRVMDSYLADMKRKYAGQNAAYDPDQFKDKASMKLALAALRAIEGAGMKVVGREATPEMYEAIFQTMHADSQCPNAIYEAAFDAAPAFGGGE